MADDYLERALARAERTRAEYGVELPVVDWIAPQPRNYLLCDEDQLCKWVVEQHPELSPFELIIEDVPLGFVTLLFAGMTRGPGRRFIERRLHIELEDDLAFYTERVYFSIVRSEVVLDESDLVRSRTPRWATR